MKTVLCMLTCMLSLLLASCDQKQPEKPAVRLMDTHDKNKWYIITKIYTDPHTKLDFAYAMLQELANDPSSNKVGLMALNKSGAATGDLAKIIWLKVESNPHGQYGLYEIPVIVKNKKQETTLEASQVP